LYVLDISIGPYGNYCGCRWLDEEGNKLEYAGMGCPNPSRKLEIEPPEKV
jgi:hypothetical protein